MIGVKKNSGMKDMDTGNDKVRRRMSAMEERAASKSDIYLFTYDVFIF